MSAKAKTCSLLFVLSFSFINCLNADPCNFDVKITQTLLNEGFHRNITYAIEFSSEDSEDPPYLDCIVGLEQTLPPGVYVNPDELGDLKRQNKITAIPKNRVNVELPAEQSSESGVFVVAGARRGVARLWLPVHARYHRAVPNAQPARNAIGPPRLYARCPHARLQACRSAPAPPLADLCSGDSKEKCSWKAVPYTLMSDTLIWSVPVGNTDHHALVAWGTLTVVAAGSLYLLNTIHEYKVEGKKRQ